jgi:hypothetical protein
MAKGTHIPVDFPLIRRRASVRFYTHEFVSEINFVPNEFMDLSLILLNSDSLSVVPKLKLK